MKSQLSKRQFLVGVSTFALVPSFSSNAHANPAPVFMHIARFIAGLLFDQAIAFFLRYASKKILLQMKSGRYQRSNNFVSTYRSPPPSLTEADFNHEAYKAAIVTYGIADYMLFKQERIRIIASEADMATYERLETIVKYMQENGIGLRRYFDELSYPVTESTTLDDLLSVEYFTFPNNEDDVEVETKKMISALIEKTGVTAFNELI